MIFDRERGPYPVAYDLTQCGRLRRLTALENTGNTFSVGFETLDRELFNPECCYGELARLGARFARIQSGWARCEKSPGVYDFDWLDRVVASFLAIGMEPWMSLTFGNPLYSPGAKHPSAVGCPPVNYGPRAVSGWERFVAEIVRRYRGKIRYYEIWNEPDNRQFWGPGAPNPAEYIELVRITSAVIRREDPATKIIGGATAMGRLFSRECFQLGLGKYCDIYSFHAYGMYPEFGFGNNVAMLRALIDRYAPGMELWLGESGCPSQSREQYDEWLKLYDCSEEIQAKWLARRIATNFRFGVRFFSYYHASDLTLKPYINGDGVPTRNGRAGLLHQPGARPKEAFHVMNHFCSFFDDRLRPAALRGMVAYDSICNPLIEGDRNLFANILLDTYTRDGYPAYVYYFPGDIQRGSLLTSALGNSFSVDGADGKILEEPVLLDLYSGKVFRVDHFEVVAGLMHIKGLPLTDYPMVLTDRRALELETKPTE